MWAILGAVCLFTVALPDPAAAWGPGVHMVTGNWVLQNLTAVPAAVAWVLMRYPGRYLHGLLSADIFIGKGSKAQKGHSHNWSSGFSLLRQADSPAKQAYAYGYISHLAADTVAHNIFVPGLLHTLPRHGGRTAHVFLEAQADRLLDWDRSDALGVFQEAESADAHAMLRKCMHQEKISFLLKNSLFQKSIHIAGSRPWRASMRWMDSLLQRDDREDLLAHMLRLSTRAMVNVLCTGEETPLLCLDPIGADALQKAGAAAGSSKNLLLGPLACILPHTGPGAARREPARHEPARQGLLRVRVPDVINSLGPVCARPGETTGHEL